MAVIPARHGLRLAAGAAGAEAPAGQRQRPPTRSAASLGFTRRQAIGMIVLPRGVKRTPPPRLNLCLILTIAPVRASVVGMTEIMTLAGYVLLRFFAYRRPIAQLTMRLERRCSVPS